MRLLFFISSAISIAFAVLADNINNVWLKINNTVIHAEVAASKAAREEGLSYRDALAANAGMLLVFETSRKVCLWMPEVRFALDAAFVDADGVIVGTVHMMPHTDTLHCAPQPVLYALEVNAGWLEANEVRVGDKVHGLSTSN
ncbi:DUF192 domain-containing protein [Candidatus Persebacteraceae bacterium Df01]|jgi:uncharacterized membrane protein (UPF0127 family)|uniref:DUF192 domain-containing protein n=1 Tax=Candidatus Doriopsillibacter californiensis TaxID=2970740 RepID=A0ABT7QJU1_9GAMM|nr:DUF192 domain-containing protein [Candidatus Persebacteraceae bacterium Df01]